MKLRIQHGSVLKYSGLGMLAILLGCSGGIKDAPKLAPAEGVVRWQGKALNDATVTFTPQSGPIAVGSTDDQGHFSLVTQGKPGASLGDHSVTISAFEPRKPSAQKSAPKDPTVEEENTTPPVSRIPEKFNNLKQSNLTATVKEQAAENTFQFDLK